MLHPSPALWAAVAAETSGGPAVVRRAVDPTARLPANRLLAMRHAQAHVGAFAILETKHVIADGVPTTRFLPDFGRMQRRKIEFLATDGIHLFTQNLHDLERDPLAQRQV